MPFVLVLGVWAQRRAGSDTTSYFLSGRSLPWWLAGASMAASTFSVDTPLYVANLTRTQGVWRNWEWWFMGISGILAATVMARYWRRAGILTDLELITLRYSGRAAHLLRGFRALFFGLVFNALAMTAVGTALIKIVGVVEPDLVGAGGWPTGSGVWLVLGVVVVAVFYSVLSGFAGVVLHRSGAVCRFIAWGNAAGGLCRGRSRRLEPFKPGRSESWPVWISCPARVRGKTPWRPLPYSWGCCGGVL